VEIIHFVRELYFDDDELPVSVFHQHVHPVLLVVPAVPVAFAFKDAV
jgi:hypothetical protein